ncbi:MAG: hypothetical protein ACMXYG_02750 [Candidatus Woesearchaeota archaeon]
MASHYTEILPNITRARSLFSNSVEREKEIKIIRKYVNFDRIVEYYFEISKGLMLAYMYYIGKKSENNEFLIEYINENTPIIKDDGKLVLNLLRKTRNQISYEGKTSENFLEFYEQDLLKIIKKLKESVKKLIY